MLRFREHIKHRLGGTTELYAEWRHHDWSIDEDGVSNHGVEQLFVGYGRIIQFEVVIRRALHADNLANGDTHSGDQ